MKIKILFILFFTLLSKSYAEDDKYFLEKIWENFSKWCYQYYWVIEKDKLIDNLKDGKFNSYKVNLNTFKDLKILQNGYLLPSKNIWNEKVFIEYTNLLWNEIKELNDNNKNTFYQIDTLDNDEINLKLEKELLENNFKFLLEYESRQYNIELYISTDWENYSKVDKSNIEQFSFQYIKLKAECNKDICIREKLKFYELNFNENRQSIVINSFFDSDIEFLSKYNCEDFKYTQEPKYYNEFNIQWNTQNIDLDLKQNPNYNLYFIKDYDNDWIEDEKDNCPFVFNPEQIDTWATWIWDTCSDKDSDGIIWEKDNCPNVYNPDQKDSDKNGVWDACELDSDWDWLPDTIDNCLNVANPNQEDIDSDWVWDACDNCKNKFNLSQEDVDNDWIWDVCDEVDDRYIESNKWFFIWLLIFITIVFGAGIFFIIRKLK